MPPWVYEKEFRSAAQQALEGLTSINRSQKAAIARACLQGVTLWQGPPGTGKTRTLLGLMEVLVRAAGREGVNIGKILAVADTNAAVDNLVEGLAARGIRVLRWGRAAKTRPSCVPHTMEAMVDRSPELRAVRPLREELSALKLEIDRLPEGPERGELMARRRQVMDDIRRLEKAARETVLGWAQVVCSTCNSCADLPGDYKIVVMDEATQATEPSSLIPLTRGAMMVVMAGDQKQLPPTVISQAAVSAGLNLPLFERLIRQGLEYTLLDTQYRMHPAIMEFPSGAFYGGLLRSGVPEEARPVPKVGTARRLGPFVPCSTRRPR